LTPTDGTLLAGRVAYRQWREGYRTGVEPVLLAACVPARPGERVVEAGCGAGAGLLCLAARVSDVEGLGLEVDPALAELAAANFDANGFLHCGALACDVDAWRPDRVFDHGLANPPWHDPAGTPSPDPGRQRAKEAASGLLGVWTMALSRALRRRGTLSLILPASSVAAGTSALRDADCGEITLMPIWPSAGKPARLVVLRGTRQGRGPDRLLPGLALHDAAGGYTAEADAVLRAGAALAL